LPEQRPSGAVGWILPIVLLCVAYGLLGLTFTDQLTHTAMMQRCVLVDPNRSRIWSVGNVEIGLSYFGVFAGMVYYYLRIYRHNRQHIVDLGLAVTYILVSFIIDYICVQTFRPFTALLIGDAAVMTFALAVSRQTWFQRLLGIFVPLIFFTCAVGHFLEGLSYWQLTFPVNTPWTMVTADVGFAVLVNASRFPSFIRGEDIIIDLTAEKQRVEELRALVAERDQAAEALLESEARRREDALLKQQFARDVIYSVSGGHLRLHANASDLPPALAHHDASVELTSDAVADLRRLVTEVTERIGFSGDRHFDFITAISEAATNAIVHGGGGMADVSHDEDQIQVRITDAGAGMQLEMLPFATLQRGWSTKGTLGVGFTLMARADRVDILTGPSGTIVILSEYRAASNSDLNLLGTTVF